VDVPIIVEIATSTTEPYNYVENRRWTLVHNGPLKSIRFDDGYLPEGGYKIRLWYRWKTDTTYLETGGLVDDMVANEYLIFEAAKLAVLWKIRETEGDNPLLVELLNDLTKKGNGSKRDLAPTDYRNPS